MRLFVGIPLPEGARKLLGSALDGALEQIPGTIHRSAPCDWHLTLTFLGRSSPAELQALTQALESAPLGPAFTLNTAGFGVFPHAATARIAWLGVGGELEALHALQARVAAICTELEYVLEERPYTPHLTLARSSRSFDARRFLTASSPQPLSLPVDRIVVYESIANGVPRYRRRAELLFSEEGKESPSGGSEPERGG